jgi:hypothetical protein
MFKFKFERNNDGDYEALLIRRNSNIDWDEELIEMKGGERLEGTTLKIVIKTSLLYGEKFYEASLIVNDYYEIDSLGSGSTLKWCKEEINEWFEQHFWDFMESESKETYWSKIFKEDEEYFIQWRDNKTPRQLELKAKEVKEEE